MADSVGSLFGGLLGSFSSIFSNEMNLENQRELSDYQNNLNKDFYDYSSAKDYDYFEKRSDYSVSKQKELADYQDQLQRKYLSDYAQIQRQSLRRAGLNPLLAYGSGASASGGSLPSIPASSNSSSGGTTGPSGPQSNTRPIDLLAFANQGQDLQNKKANEDVSRATADKIDAEADEIRSRIPSYDVDREYKQSLIALNDTVKELNLSHVELNKVNSVLAKVNVGLNSLDFGKNKIEYNRLRDRNSLYEFSKDIAEDIGLPRDKTGGFIQGLTSFFSEAGDFFKQRALKRTPSFSNNSSLLSVMHSVGYVGY